MCVFVCVCVFVQMWVSVSVNLHMCTGVCVCLCECVCVNLNMCTDVCVCLCGCVCHPTRSPSHFFVRVQATQAHNARNWHFPLIDVCVLLPGQSVLLPMTLSAERPGLEALDTPHQPTHLLNHQRSRTKAPPSPVNTPRAFGTALVPTTLPTGGDLPSQAGLDLYSKGP